MTNKTDYAPISYNCNGATIDFPFDWKILEPESVVLVLLDEEEQETILNYGEDYTVEFDEVGGSVKTKIAYPVGNVLILKREASIYQDKSFSTSTGFQASEIEKAFDRNSINLQDMDYKIDEFKQLFSQQVNEKIDENKEDTDRQIEENKEDTDKQIEDNKEDTDNQINVFKGETDAKIAAINSAVEQANTISVAANTKADQALANSQNAITTSNNALSAANNAVEISGIANANSTNAVNTANGANINSTNAVNTANAANLTANEALTSANAASQKVDEFGQDIEKVIEAAEKIDELEGAVIEAKVAAAQATVAADNAVEAADDATQAAQQAFAALDSKQDKFVVGAGLDLTDGVLSNTQTSANWGNITGEIENQIDLKEKFDLIDDKINELQTSKLPNATIIGNPHLEGSFVSGFSENNYLQFPFVDISQGLPFEIYFSFTTGSNVTTQQNILDSYFGIALAIQNGKGVMALSSNGTSWDIGLATGTNTLLANTTYYAKMAWTGAQYTTALSLDGETYTPDMILNSALSPHKTTIYIGASPNLFGAGTSHPFLGTINFNGAKVIVDGVGVVYEGYADIGFQTRADVSLSNIDEAGKDVIRSYAGSKINIPNEMFDFKYSQWQIFNASWMLSNGQWNSKFAYPKQFEALVIEHDSTIEIGTTVTLPSGGSYVKKGLPVKESSEDYTDYDFVLRLTEEEFRLAPKIKLPSGKAVVGNGMTLGVTNGTNNYGITTSSNTGLVARPNSYGAAIGTNDSSAGIANPQSFGITTDPTKSGMELADSDLYLYFYIGDSLKDIDIIEAGKVMEQLNGLVEINSVLIDSFVDGASGYRIWSDGYCEQWGKITVNDSTNATVNFLKVFKDNNYTFDIHGIRTAGSDYYAWQTGIWQTRNESSMQIRNNSGGTMDICWKVCGYLAGGEY